jgi:hypothetical protein
VRPRFLHVLAACVPLAGCGYVGDPQPPSLQVPAAVADLAAEQRGGRIHLRFTLPAVTTDGVGIRTFPDVELTGGPEGAAERIPVGAAAPGPVELDVPVGDWAGKRVVFQARSQGRKGRWSAWSNVVVLEVAVPQPPPSNVAVKAVEEGVLVSWQGAAGPFRIWRKGAAGVQPALAATVNGNEYLDREAVLGQSYSYQVQAAGSERSAEVSITVTDTFPPPAPLGLSAVASIEAIELSWEPVTAADLRGYRVYRAAGEGVAVLIADAVGAPAYSDRTAEAGVEYRYAVSALDEAGNESARSGAVMAKRP